ncbi:MAG: hypothetical protein LUC88_08455 [Prevotella sp.]|nr:hypothetical protein [Prevotella sp.]
MSGPYFTKPTLRNVLCNIPLTIPFIVLTLAGIVVKIPLIVTIVLCLPVIVFSAFIKGAYDVLRSKATFFTLPVSLVISAVLFYQSIQIVLEKLSPSRLSFLSVGGSEIIIWILCGVMCLFTALCLTFFLNWMLTRNDDSQSDLFERVLKSKALKTVVVCCVIESAILFAVLLFDPWFVYDETFTLHVVSLGYADGIDITAHDVHPPLYYIMLKAWLSALSFGSNNIYVITVLARLFSLVPYVLLVVLCQKNLRVEEWRHTRWLLLLCFCAFYILFRYGIEMRMYSWALLFVTATFLYARNAMLGRDGWSTWIIITFFSVCAAYTHYYGLISAAVIWLVLLVWFFLHDRRILLKWGVCAAVAVLAYLPWVISILLQVRLTSEEYWMSLTMRDFISIFFFLLFPVHVLLPFLFVKVLRTRDDRKLSFDDLFGVIVPAATLVMGVAASLLFRPMLQGRFLVPSLFCMCISLFFIFRHARSKERFVFLCMLLFSFLVTNGYYISSFIIDCRSVRATHQMLGVIGTDATIVYPSGEPTGESARISSLTKSKVVTFNQTFNSPPLDKQRTELLFPNIRNFDNKEDMREYILHCKSLYCIINYDMEKEDTLSLIPHDFTSVYVGNYKIGYLGYYYNYHLYKLIPNGEQEE